ncbi:ParA family protein [Altererythrobacter sp. GH1-8]|uniref:ParA family protein n=1 Tax=Altererythrobacter sp. GH1-8 TaxID=3349333 RepID=UPI00374D0507
MARIAIYSVKGGVGKTTMAANLAWCSAQISRRRTLLWDLDPANGSGFLFGVEPREKRDARSVIAMDRDPGKLARKTAFKNLHVLPADESIRTLDRQFDRLGKRKRLAKIAARLDKDYERIIFDCPPVLNELSDQVFRASDLIIVPLPPSPLSSRAFDTVVAAIKQSGKGHPPILPVLSMIDMRRKLHQEAREANPDWPFIPAASAVEQSAVRQEPVGAFDARSPAATAFARLWTAIERKLAKR